MKRLWFIGTLAALALVVSAGVLYAHSKKEGTSFCPSKSEINLRMDMRKLWDDHNALTLMQIESVVANLPDKDAVTARLLKNQEQIGEAIVPFYGKAAGEKLTSLLKGHIVIAGDLVTAVKAGDKVKAKEAEKKWQANADEIVAFLSGANPKYWPKDTLRGMMDAHLALIKEIASDIINKKSSDEMSAYDRSRDHVLMMADALSDGIVKQFPKKFGSGEMVSENVR